MQHVYMDASVCSIAELIRASQRNAKINLVYPPTLTEEENITIRRLKVLIHDCDGSIRSEQYSNGPFCHYFKENDAIEFLLDWACNQSEQLRELIFKEMRICSGKNSFSFKQSCGECRKCNKIMLLAAEFGLYDIDM